MEKSKFDTYASDLTLEKALYKFADKINVDIGIVGEEKRRLTKERKDRLSACSIFLYDSRRDGFVLRASTLGSSYLGKAQINLSPDDRTKFKENRLENIGLTSAAIMGCDSIVVEDITKDKRFSVYQMSESQYESWASKHYCEFPRDKIGSIIIVPIFLEEGKYPAGVLRIARSSLIVPKFNEKDKNKIEKIIRKNVKWIKSKIFLSQLIELGSYMEIPDLCERAVRVLKDLLHAKGCSVFVLDDEDFDISGEKSFQVRDGKEVELSNKELKYKCYGTTGLVYSIGQANIQIEDPIADEDSWYTCSHEDITMKGDTEAPEMSITLGCVRARMCAFVPNLHEENEDYETNIRKLFPPGCKIKRKKGKGKVCEYFIDTDGKYRGTGNILYAPMFYGDPHDKYINVLGVVRIQRPEGTTPFTDEERHLFVSMVEHLSKAVTFARLVGFLDNVAKIKNSQFLYVYIIRNVPKFINAVDCALLVAESTDENLFKIKAEWKEGMVTYHPDKDHYVINDPERRGYSGWVARERRILRFNGKEDLDRIKKELPLGRHPKHRQKAEGGGPYRFLGVPIPDPSDDQKSFAVIRVCANQEANRLTKQAELELSLIARRIRPYIEKSIEDEKKQNERNALIQKIFSKDLQERAMSLKNVTCKGRIKSFFRRIETQYTIDRKILNFLPELWKLYIEKTNRHIKYIENFDFFNTNILTEIPFYRDHFVHQFVVYLIGLIVIDQFYDEFTTAYKSAYPKDGGGNDNERFMVDAEHSWLITALFHDTAYPFEKLNSWLNRFLDKIIREDGQEGGLSLPLDGLLFRPHYIDRIDALSQYLCQISGQNRGNYRKIRELLVKELNENNQMAGVDHGIIGALLLLGDTGFGDKDILPCASAIALHNKFLYKMNDFVIDFDNHPLAFLLIYCDMLHEWGRGTSKEIKRAHSIEEDAPRLKEIEITNIEKTKTVLFSIEIDKDTANYHKEREIKKVFDRIRSSNIRFFVKLNERRFSLPLSS